jgi:hypothetical protein
LAPRAATTDLSPEPSRRDSATFETVALSDFIQPFTQPGRLVGCDLHLVASAAEIIDLGAGYKQAQLAYAFRTLAEMKVVAVIKPAAGQELVDLRLPHPHTDSEDVVIALVTGRLVAVIGH